MKTAISILALNLISSWNAFGRPYFFTQSELIDKASVIAIVVLDEPEAAKPTGKSPDPFVEEDGAYGKNCTYSKQAQMRVEKVLKGKIEDDSILYGGENHAIIVHAQCSLSKGRFLAFLSKDRELWAGVNWQLSLRPIRKNQVEWYVSAKQRFPMKFQDLEGVLAQIRAGLKKQHSEQDVTPNR